MSRLEIPEQMVYVPPDLETFLCDQMNSVRSAILGDEQFLEYVDSGAAPPTSETQRLYRDTKTHITTLVHVLDELDSTNMLLVQGNVRPVLNLLEQYMEKLQRQITELERTGDTDETWEVQTELNAHRLLYEDQLSRI